MHVTQSKKKIKCLCRDNIYTHDINHVAKIPLTLALKSFEFKTG